MTGRHKTRDTRHKTWDKEESLGSWVLGLGSFIALIVVLASLCSACGSTRTQRTYTGRGRVVEIVTDQQSIYIDHEEIKGFMPAMKMLFSVKDPALLEGLEPDDLVEFELVVTDRASWISTIKKSGTGWQPVATKAQQGASGEPPNPSIQQVGPSLRPGQPLPELALIDQEGRPVRLASWSGKPMAITFIFTRCPLPEYCPLFTQIFSQVQRQLAPQFKDRFHLLSISFDPDYDTPNVLKEYGKSYGADFGTWSFLTGPKDEIKKITGACGVQYWSEDESISHTAACAIVTPTGTLYNLYRGNSWTADQIVGDLTALLIRQ